MTARPAPSPLRSEAEAAGSGGGADGAALLSVQGAGKSFGGLAAVDDVSFSVREGEILGLAGPNGSGKSTLFNIITRIPVPPDRGRIVFAGKDLRRRAPHRIARSGLARTFQRETVFASLSAVDNALVAVEQSGRRGRLAGNVALAEEALERVGFPATLHNHASGALPVYFKKLVMIGAAMALRPRLLLLDEPASGLAPHEIEKLQGLILRLNREGMTILLIEHVLPLLTAVSGRLMVMDQGRIIALGAPQAVLREPAVVEAYLGAAQ